MKKGFTLIELLAVLLIMSIILVIALPHFVGVLEDAKTSARDKVYNLAESAGRMYSNDYNIPFGTNILISELCAKNYLECPLVDPVTDTELTGYVKSINDPSTTGSIIFEYYD